MQTIQSIMAQIQTLSFEDQRMLNKVLVAHLKAEHKMVAADAAMNFRVGDIVQFDAGPRKGGITKIKINGFSRDLSTVKGVQVGGFREGVNWNVGATLCKKVA